MAFKPIDPKRDEFRRYLERSGVIEALTKVFVRLVTERPENPMEFLQAKLGDSKLQSDHEAYMRKELEEAKAEIQRLRQRILAIDPTALDDEKSTPSDATTDNSTGTKLDPKGKSGSQNDLVAKGNSSTGNDRKKTDATDSEVNSNHPRSEDQHQRDANVEGNMEVPDDHCKSNDNVKEISVKLPSDSSIEKENE